MVTAKRCLKMSEMSAAGKFFGSGLEEMRKAVRKIDGLSRVQSIYNTLLTDSGQNLLIFLLIVSYEVKSAYTAKMYIVATNAAENSAGLTVDTTRIFVAKQRH